MSNLQESPSAAPSGTLIETVYSPRSELLNPFRLLVEMAKDVLKARELAFVLFKRNMKGQFRQSILGYTWLFFPPLATTAVWFFLNSSGVVRVAETPIPYPAFVLIGTLLWQTFIDGLNKPIQSLSSAQAMLTKLKFPREALIIAGLGETAVVSAVRLLLLIPIFFYVDLSLSWTLLLFPLGYLSMVISGLAIGVLLAPIGLLYGDVARAIGILGQLMMYLTPVVYPMADEGVLGVVNRLNPVTYLLETARATLAGGPFDHANTAFVIFACMLALLFVGWTILRVVLPRIIERMGM